jgi:hypothetical protein
MPGRVMWAVVPVAAVLAAATPAVRAAGGDPPPQDKQPPQVVFNIPPISERIEIDGRKNPEMIPQWDVWHAAFENIARVSDVPTEVYRHISREEAAAIVEAAKTSAQNYRATQDRVLKLMPTLKTDEARLINERTQAINLDFRWQVLRLRDSVLAGLNPAGQAAMALYVESLKAGMRVFVPKDELAFYQKPQ